MILFHLKSALPLLRKVVCGPRGNRKVLRLTRILKLSKYDDQIRTLQNELLNITSEVERINGQKNIILERKKYQVEDSKLHDNIINLKETSLKLTNNINLLKLELKDLTNEYNNLVVKLKDQTNITESLKNDKNKLDIELTNLIRQENNLKNNISNLKDAIDNNASIHK